MGNPELKLSAEVECWPLWLDEGEGSVAENVDPADLEISDELRTQLYEWAATWDAQYSLSDPQDAVAGEEIDMDAFGKRGRIVLERLRKECGDAFEITYDETQVG